MLGVLLAASCTAVTVGGAVVEPPLVFTVPVPLKVKLKLMPACVLLPASVGKLPVYPAKLPVPPVMVADALPEPPNRMEAGSEYFPNSVPPLSVIVKSAVTVEPVIPERGIVLAKVPLPTFVSVILPEFTYPRGEGVVFPVRVSVLLPFPACAPAATSSAMAKGANLLKMVPVEKRF